MLRCTPNPVSADLPSEITTLLLLLLQTCDSAGSDIGHNLVLI
jgi:hypothetical protein